MKRNFISGRISLFILAGSLTIWSSTLAGDVSRSPKELCAAAPNWIGVNVQYSKKLEKSGKPITYQEWAQLFQSKLVYDYDRWKFVLWTAENRAEEDYVGKPAAFLLVKVRVSDDACGVLVLEEGFS